MVWHGVSDCPHFHGLRRHVQHAEIFQASHDAIRSIIWHENQKSALFNESIVKEAQTS